MKNKNKAKKNYSLSGERLGIAIKRAGLTMQQVADKCGFSDGKYISDMVHGRKNVTNLDLFSRVLDVSADWLTGKTDMLNGEKRPFKNKSDYYASLFRFFEYRGYTITFKITLAYSKNKERIEVGYNDIVLDTLDKFSTPFTYVHRDGNFSECIIDMVGINGKYVSYFYFIAELERLEGLIDCSLDGIISLFNKYSLIPILEDGQLNEEKLGRAFKRPTAKDILQETIDEVKKIHGKNAVGDISNNELG